MDIVRYAAAIDLSRFAGNIAEPEALYGLPNEVKFCRRCVISNQRPNSAVEYRHARETRNRECFGLPTDQFRSPDPWIHESGEWKLRRAVWHETGVNSAR